MTSSSFAVFKMMLEITGMSYSGALSNAPCSLKFLYISEVIVFRPFMNDSVEPVLKSEKLILITGNAFLRRLISSCLKESSYPYR